jgi:hypothetical protein
MADDTKYTAEDVAIREKLREILGEEVSETDSLATALEKGRQKLDQMAKKAAQMNTSAEKAIELQEELARIATDAQDRMDVEVNMANERLRLITEEKNLALDMLKLKIQRGEVDDDEYLTILERVSATAQEEKALAKAAQAQRDSKSAADSAAKSILGVSDAWSDTFVGSIISGKMSLKDFAGAAKETLTVDNLMGSAMGFVAGAAFESAMAYDQASSAMQKATGQGELYNETLDQAMLSNNSSLRTWDQMAGAITDLNSEFAQFNMLAAEDPGLAARMADTVATLEGLGASGTVVAGNMDVLNKTFGYTAEEARGLTTEMAVMGLDMGMTADEVMQNFTAAAPRMALFGKKGVEVFSDLQEMAASTGVEIGTMLNMSEQFDTFEGAGKAVGSLNAMLGTNLNMMDMMMMSDNERVEAIVAATEAGDLQWNSMNRFQKQAVANAAGISDMAEAERMFAGGVSGLRAFNLEKRSQADAEAEAAQRAEEALTIQERNTAAMQQAAGSVSDLVQKIEDIQQAFWEWYQTYEPIIQAVGLVVAGLWGASKVMGPLKAGIDGVSTAGSWLMEGLGGIKDGLMGVQEAGGDAADLLSSDGVEGMSDLMDGADAATGATGKLEFAQMSMMGKIALIAGVVAAAFAAFFIIKEITEWLWDFMGPWSIIIGLILAAAAAVAAFNIAATLGVASAPIIGGIVGVAGVIGVAAAAISKLQEAETGMTDSPGGATLVGEGGPEIVTMPEGGNVITNENLNRLGQMTDERLTLEGEMAGTLQTAQAAATGGGGTTGPVTVVLQLKERELGRAVVDIINNRPEVRTVMR